MSLWYTIKSWIPGTEANKTSIVEEGLKYVEHFDDHNQEAYQQFRDKIQHCQKGKRSECPYTVLELRDAADHISPGLGNVGLVWRMATCVSNK